MARINSNIASLVARANLSRANQDLEVRLQRLATGLQINRGADNPAGLIVSERLRSEISGLTQAINNSERASSVIATTEASLAEIADLLSSINSLVVEAANTGAVSPEEREANQLQIDSAIESITRISNSASFAGLKLLNGELDYVLSGLIRDDIAKAQIHGANFAGQSNIQVNVEVLASAQTGNLYMRADYDGPNAAQSGRLLSATTLEIAGNRGVQVLQFPMSATVEQMRDSINSFREATGVSAALVNPADASSGLIFSSMEYGSNSFVSVNRMDGPSDGGYFQTFKLANNAPVPDSFSFSDPDILALLTESNRDTGRDVTAVVNGTLANGNGLQLSMRNSTSLSFDMLLDRNFATNVGSTTEFHITGGGALYQLGGEINTSQQMNIGISSVAASRLGGTLIGDDLQFLSSLRTGGENDLSSGNFQAASQILQTSIDEVSMLRGRLGALERNTLQTNMRSLQAAVENLTASESLIRDADFAAEISALTRAQILSGTGTTVLALANQQPQQILQLLG